jgi:hypothetical protein
MTGMSQEAYARMMLDGGRPIDGNRHCHDVDRGDADGGDADG